uniref:Uncharacterized protein n=1 Tax=Candidatus Kentrum sp. TC TaxID=2126339 RepID=A0A450Z981_9GAMM|nr:MAG: hypothetical protein BECKTC1821D_GA0114238_11007 [Candidatus Kentron sp. TC]
MKLVADVEDFRAPEDNTKHPRKKARMRRSAGVVRPWRGKRLSRSPGSPERLLIIVKEGIQLSRRERETLATEPGWRLTFTTMEVLKGIRLSGHVAHKGKLSWTWLGRRAQQTSLRGVVSKAKTNKQHRFRNLRDAGRN